MTARFKTFPPGWNNIKVPTHHKGATLAGIATYGPCARRGEWAQRAAWGLVTLGGPRLLPGRTTTWRPPLRADEWQALLGELQAAAGVFSNHTVYERRDNRQGLLMLLLDGDKSVGFVKARAGDATGLVREEESLRLVEQADVRSFLTPRVLGSGIVAGWRYLVTSAMPPRMHRMPAGAPIPAVLEDIAAALTDLSRPEDAPDRWQPFHGDFTPWNLRRIGDTTPWLIDWEDAGWAPPQADTVLYFASAYAVGRPVGEIPDDAAEAVEYWWDEITRRTNEKLAEGLEPQQVDYGMIEALDAARRARRW
jgi:hypothetical protein